MLAGLTSLRVSLSLPTMASTKLYGTSPWELWQGMEPCAFKYSLFFYQD